MRRKKMNKKSDRKNFSRTAKKVNKRNMVMVKRGGGRL